MTSTLNDKLAALNPDRRASVEAGADHLHTEYLRADLPPTLAESMRCPEVMALVDELHYIVLCLKTIALHSNDERFRGVSRVAWLRLQDILDSLDTQDQNKATEND